MELVVHGCRDVAVNPKLPVWKSAHLGACVEGGLSVDDGAVVWRGGLVEYYLNFVAAWQKQHVLDQAGLVLAHEGFACSQWARDSATASTASMQSERAERSAPSRFMASCSCVSVIYMG